MRLPTIAIISFAIPFCGCSVILPAAGYFADWSEAQKKLAQTKQQTRYDVELRSGRKFNRALLTTFENSDTVTIKGSQQLDTVVHARDVTLIQAPITPIWTAVGAVWGIFIDFTVLNSMPNMTLIGQRKNRETP